ncbi:hypothetical protein BDW74DRAFT_178369 [Aspergillus multicolor]|uniref:uncharacterized protein n=1 Tax=Aspergillus multicolor TaxID=41759 RepID=UPI003CCE21CC
MLVAKYQPVTLHSTVCCWVEVEKGCHKLWGPGTYDIDVETDDWESFSALIRREHDNELGMPLIMTMLCRSEDAALAELDRMLRLMVQQEESGEEMTVDETLEIFAGPRGEYRGVLRQFIEMGRQGQAENQSQRQNSGQNSGQEMEEGAE